MVHVSGNEPSASELRRHHFSDAEAISAVFNISVPWGEGRNTNYNSLQIVGRKTFSHGLIVQGNFTWAKALTNMMQTGGQQSGRLHKSQTTRAQPRILVVVRRPRRGGTACGNNGIPRSILLSERGDSRPSLGHRSRTASGLSSRLELAMQVVAMRLNPANSKS